MKTFKTLLIFFLFVTVFSGCSVRQVNESHQNEPLQDTTRGGDKQGSSKADVIPGFHPFKDDPDNPSPHNPLVRKFGDIPEVRTYIRLQQKLHDTGLTLDEAIELYTAEVHLYPSDTTKANLKRWKKDKERYIRLGTDMSGIALSIVKEKDKDKEDTD